MPGVPQPKGSMASLRGIFGSVDGPQGTSHAFEGQGGLIDPRYHGSGGLNGCAVPSSCEGLGNPAAQVESTAISSTADSYPMQEYHVPLTRGAKGGANPGQAQARNPSWAADVAWGEHAAVSGPQGGRNNTSANGNVAIKGEGKSRIPLSGGGPKRTDYIKKYGGSSYAPEGNSPSGVPITTMMLKNIPCRKAQEEVMMHIDQKGFGNRYDFFYLPRDVKFRANLGYAFINFITPEDAHNFQAEMNGYRFSGSGSAKACIVVPAHVQGLTNNLAAFKRTEVMRSSRKPYFSGVVTL